MGKRGPKKKPTALRVFEGNPGHLPINENEPKPEGKAVKPADLGSIASKCWDESAAILEPLNLLTNADTNAFMSYCHAWEDYTIARSDVEKHGAYCIDQNGKSILSAPYRRMLAAFERVRRLQSEFGMTPAARTGLSVSSQAGKDNLDDFKFA